MGKIEKPKNVKWLLDFLNLGCTPGEFNLRRQIRIYVPYLFLEPHKIQPGTRVTNSMLMPDTIIKRSLNEPPKLEDFSEFIRQCLKIARIYTDVYQTYMLDSKDKFIPVGKAKFCPNLEDLKSFLINPDTPLEKRTNDIFLRGDMSILYTNGWAGVGLEKAISRGAYIPFKREESYLYLSHIWQTSIHFIWYFMLEIKVEQKKLESSPHIVSPCGFTTNIKTSWDSVHDFYMSNQKKVDFRKLSLDRNITFDHDGSLPLAIFAFLLDFKHNHKELHHDLYQCKYCGKFDIEKKKKMYCSDKCRKKYDQASREANKASKASGRKWQKEQAKKEIINWICTKGFTRKYAEIIYEKERESHKTNVASLINFIRTSGRTILKNYKHLILEV